MNLPTFEPATFPTLVAHRGGAAEAPENTLAAFRHALSLGIRWFELDVQMSRDGELVVIHDQTVDRTTNGTGEVGSLLLQELRTLDAGSWFGGQFRGERVPTLRETLELCIAEDAGVLIELKSPQLYPGMEEKVAALLSEAGLAGGNHFWCISFDHAAIDRLRELAPDVPLGYLYRSDVASFVPDSDTIEAALPHFSLAARYPDQIARAHESGKRVFTWTVNTKADIELMVALGVDAIISDHPSLLVERQQRRHR